MRIFDGLALSASACLAMVSGGSDADPTGEPTVSSEVPASSAASPTATPTPTSNDMRRDLVDNPPGKSWQDALEAARGEFTGDPSKIELETNDRGTIEYKIELKSADTEYTVEYDAETLEKLSEEKESLGDEAAEELKETFDPDSLIGLKDAVATARGEQAGTITSWKIEGQDDGRAKYEFDILPEGSTQDIEVEIDAKDGTVIADS